MNRTDSKLKFDSSIEKAEQAVQNSLDRFESAMEHLAEKVEVTSQKLHHVRDVAMDSKEKLLHFKDEVQQTFDPLKPYLNQARDISNRAMVQVRSNPRPYIWAAAAIFGGIIGMIYWQKKGGSFRRPFSARSVDSEYSSEFPYQ